MTLLRLKDFCEPLQPRSVDLTGPICDAWCVFCVTEAEAAAIRAVFHEEGELTAAIELRRLFPGILDNVQARQHARTIAGWRPLPAHPAISAVVPLRARRQT